MSVKPYSWASSAEVTDRWFQRDRFSSAAMAAVLTLDDVAPHYQLVVDKTHEFPTLAVQVEPTERAVDKWGGFDAARSEALALSARVSELLRGYLGLNPEILIVSPKSIPRSEGKAVRVVERRAPGEP